MQIITFNANARSIALSKVGRRSGQMTVKFSTGNEVHFDKYNNALRVRWIQCNYSTNYLYHFGSSTRDMSEEENTMLVAAMIIMNVSTVVVGHREAVTLGAPNLYVADPVVIVVEEPVKPARHATGWDRAQEFGISGHAKQRQQERRPAEEPRRQVPSKPLGKWGWAAVIAVATVAVVAAATSDNN